MSLNPSLKYAFQKWLFIFVVVLLNTTLILLAHFFNYKWYYTQIPLLLVFAYNIITIVLILINAAIKVDKRLAINDVPNRSIAFFIPCYNESAQEIRNSLNSFLSQKNIQKHAKVCVTVCDGRKTGKNNSISTDRILSQEIFKNSCRVKIQNAYIDSYNQSVDVEVLYGVCQDNFPYFVIIKQQNKGKRDSIALLRRLLIRYNQNDLSSPIINKKLITAFQNAVSHAGISHINYIIGVDADTIFDERCTIELLRQIERKENILATTGMVKVSFPETDSCLDRVWQGYQHVEYISGQGLVRHQQQMTQQKISCLPGCLNIIRVNQKTCGEMLLSIYTEPPQETDHIFQRIRGTASEDRHSVMLLLKMYGDCHTTVNWNAHAETGVPLNLSVFLSQRKRWSLGSATHGMWMIFMENIPLWQRFSSFMFVLTYMLNPYLMYSLVMWVWIVCSGRADTTFWIMTGIVQIVTLYKLCIPIWVSFKAKERVYYYLFYPLYYFMSPIVSTTVFCYSLYYMDDFGWGKTREVVEALPTVTYGKIAPMDGDFPKTACRINGVFEGAVTPRIQEVWPIQLKK